MIHTYRMSHDSLRELAFGGSDAAGRNVLRSAQLSKHLLLLRKVLDRVECEPPFKAGFELLKRVDTTNATALRSVLTYPHTGAWLTRCLREPTWLDLAYLGAVAAVAAIRAGMDFEIPVPVRMGTAHLPSLGSARVGTDDGLATAYGLAGRHWIESGTIRVELPSDPHEDGPHWQGLRTLPGSSIVLDDIDPYRPPAKLGFTGRLSAEDAGKWYQAFDEANAILAAGNKASWADASELLRSIVPLRRGSDGNGVSTTSRDAFGCFEATLPHTGEAFAAAIVHEVQHNKLTALHTLIPMVEEGPERYYSPWRSDPRPAYGLMHGCYAFIGVTDFWVTRIGEGPLAAFQFLRAAGQVRSGLRTLAAVPNLTEAGKTFAWEMTRKAQTWDTSAFPSALLSTVEDLLADHRIAWCLTNRTVQPQDAAVLADAWLAGTSPGELPVPQLSTTVAENFEAGERLRLMTTRMSTPRQSEEIRSSASLGDIALAEGEYSAAQEFFERQYGAGDITVWSGLALASIRLDGPSTWSERPELVRAVHRRLSETLAEPPAPGVIANWLASGR